MMNKIIMLAVRKTHQGTDCLFGVINGPSEPRQVCLLAGIFILRIFLISLNLNFSYTL